LRDIQTELSSTAEARSDFAGNRVVCWTIVVCLTLMYSLSQFDHGLWTPDEPRVGAIAREATQGRWLIPTLNTAPFLEEPPLHTWMVAGVLRVFGHSQPEIGRAISWLFGVGGLIVIFLLGRLMGSEAGRGSSDIGLYAALTLGLSLEYFAVAHRLVVDGALTFFTTSAALLYYRAISSDRSKAQIGWSAAASVAVALAFMTKGPIGLAVPLLLVASVAIVMRSREPVRRSRLWFVPVALLIVAGPWLTLVVQELGWAGFQKLFIENTLWRIWPSAEYTGGHRQPVYYYLFRLIPHLGPAAALVIPGVVKRFRQKSGATKTLDRASDIALTWFCLGFVLLSLAGTKRALYLLPLFPALAVSGGIWLYSVIHDGLRSSFDRFAFGLLGIGLALAGSTPLAIQLVLQAGFVASDAPVAALASLSFSSTLLLALIGIGAGAYTVRQAAVSRPRAALAGLLTGFLVCMLLTRSIIVPLVDQQKNLEGVSRRIAALVPGEAQLVLFNPDETTLAMVSLYMERRAVVARSASELSSLCTSGGSLYLLVLDKQKGESNFKAIRALGGELVLEEGRAGGRKYRLLRYEPKGLTTTSRPRQRGVLPTGL